MRGPGPAMRWTKIVDPVTGRLVAFTMVGTFGRADRTIWMDGRPHPSKYAEHTFAGFSTGEWVGNALKVTTTHMKTAVIQRNGSPSSYKGVMTEMFVRHGEHLMMLSVIDDPVYLEEPMVRTANWTLAPGQHVGPANPFETVDELADKPLGWVPHWPLGTRHTGFAEQYGLPVRSDARRKGNTSSRVREEGRPDDTRARAEAETSAHADHPATTRSAAGATVAGVVHDVAADP